MVSGVPGVPGVPPWVGKVNLEKFAALEDLAREHSIDFAAEIRKCDAWWRAKFPAKCGLNARWLSRLTNWIHKVVESKLQQAVPARARGFQPESHGVRERKAIG